MFETRDLNKLKLLNYKERDHRILPSSSVVPKKDEGTYFVNAGMNQFKSALLGTGSPPHPLVANSQKCVRVGGKHNDLEDVGKDKRHHTFFEMLGCWSFGEVDKTSSCFSAWDLLTRVYGLDPDRLYVTCFGGEATSGLGPDEETRDVWLGLGLSQDRVLWGNAQDNFWDMGSSGPCGPCTEIHYDLVGGGNVADRVNREGEEDVVELWNLVFIQHERGADGSLRPLGRRHLDAGMGLERLVAAVQGKSSNYDTDLFRPIFDVVERVTGARSYSGNFGSADSDGIDSGYRVLADHLRMASVCLADGLLPSNKGLGSKLRLVLDRASRRMESDFGMEPGSMAHLVDPVVESLSPAFPELAAKRAFVREVVDNSEHYYHGQKKAGRTLIRQALPTMEVHDGVVTGSSAFRFCDSKNVSPSVFRDLAGELGLSLDEPGFELCLEEHRARSRPEAKGPSPREILAQLARGRGGEEAMSPTLDVFKYDYAVADSFITFPSIQSKLIGLVKDGRSVERVDVRGVVNRSASNVAGVVEDDAAAHDAAGVGVAAAEPARDGEVVVAVFSGTNFYSESGGQLGDRGRVVGPGKDDDDDDDVVPEMEVVDARAEDGVVLHWAKVKRGSFRVGDVCELEVDPMRRIRLMANHTATHLLNYALRRLPVSSLRQMGSKVDEGHLTFDFYSTQVLTDVDVKTLQEAVQLIVESRLPVFRRTMPLPSARSLPGVVFLELEDYPSAVGVVSVGAPVQTQAELKDFGPEPRPLSTELCGGTHVINTGALEGFLITGLNSVSLNVKRITAVTREAAKEASKNEPLLFAQVEAFESDVRRCLDDQLQTVAVDLNFHGNANAANAAASPSSVVPYLEAKLQLLRANLTANPTSFLARVELESRLARFAPALARLRHAEDLREKDRVAAAIYAQIAQRREERGQGDDSFHVQELALTMPPSTSSPSSSPSDALLKVLMRAPRQLTLANDDVRLPGFFWLRHNGNFYCLAYVNDDHHKKLTACSWLLDTASSLGISPIGGPVKRKLPQELFYFARLEPRRRGEKGEEGDLGERLKVAAEERAREAFRGKRSR